MYKIIRLNIGIILVISLLSANVFAQKHPDFTIQNQVKTGIVKSQDNTGTCWAYTTASFLEAEAIRKGKPVYDLSEMFVVRNVYTEKAELYVRLYGKANFSQGGQAHDFTNAVARYGLVPESAFTGLTNGKKSHNHEQLERFLKYILDDVAGKPSVGNDWRYMFAGLLDAHLGKMPQQFDYEGKNYTPQTFAEQAMAFNADEYVELTSYEHHPFYSQFDLEVPDNWSRDAYYNVPVNELIEVMDNALKNGFSVAWDGDVSEAGFRHQDSRADLTSEQTELVKSVGIQTARRQTFDDLSTADDHLMHLTGIATDKSGNIFYLTKNSWGKSNKSDGYLYMSSDFVNLKTIAIMVHKDAIPKTLAKKLGL